jgi:hypothetical protein
MAAEDICSELVYHIMMAIDSKSRVGKISLELELVIEYVVFLYYIYIYLNITEETIQK